MGIGFEIFLFWLVLSVAVGMYADTKGRSGIGYGLLALALSPIIGFIFAFLADDQRAESGPSSSSGYKKCMFCAETIKTEAIKCKHCGELQNTRAKKPEYMTEAELEAYINNKQN